MVALKVFAWMLLVFLPGAWITFGLSLKCLSFWSRLFIAAMLSPVVVAIEFYALRLAGISFETTCVLLVLINLPVLLLIAHRREGWPRVDRRTLMAIVLIGFIMLAFTAPFLLDPQKRLYTWEAWSQADVVYALANGGLDLQDADLVGFRLSYPWAGHVFQAVQSYVLGTPPVDNYIWANLVWVPMIFAFAGAMVAEFGGSRLSRVTVAVWLAFGVNFVGALGGELVPKSLVRAHSLLGTIWGDNRYTPWLDKLVFFGQMWFALGLFIAVVYLSIRPWPTESRRSYLVLNACLLVALGIVYPVLLPAAVVVIGARVFVRIVSNPRAWRKFTEEVAGIAAGVAVASLVTFAQVKFLTGERASSQLIQLNSLREMESAALTSVVVLSPLLLAFVYGFRRYWRERREAALVLALGALASCAIYTLFDIPWYRNEYKFMFTAAICLAPFPSLALEPLLGRLGRLTLPVLALSTAVLGIPLANNIYTNTFTAYTRPGPVVELDSFDLRLAPQEPLSGLMDAVRQETPIDSLLVADDSDMHLPTLTRRQLYAPPNQSAPDPGILVSNEQMITLVKGYPAATYEQRRAVLNGLFSSNDEATMAASLRAILAYDRPVAVIVDDQRDAKLRDWLTNDDVGTCVYSGNGQELWLIRSTDLNDVAGRYAPSAGPG